MESTGGYLPTGGLRALSRRTVPTAEEWSVIWRDPTTGVSLYSQVSACLLKGYLDLPTQHEPLDDLGWTDRGIGTQQRMGVELV